VVRQKVVREGFRAHVRTDPPKWSACRYPIQMMRTLQIPIRPPTKFRRHGWWTAAAVHHWQPRPAKSIRRPRTAPAQIDFRTTRSGGPEIDRKSTRLNSSHGSISYAVFCLKKKKKTQ